MDKVFYAIIVAGGSGVRMGSDVAKQFINLGNKPVIVHTIERFLALPFSVEIILVVPSDYKEYWKDYCFQNKFVFRHTLVSGGITRFHSVRNAVKYIKPDSLVAVHDGVRPFVTADFIHQLYKLAEEKGAVVPVVTPADSMRIKTETEGVTTPVDRSRYFMVQTPQVFKSNLLIDGYKQAYSPSFTDDASVVEKTGHPVFLTQGSAVNIKLTRKEDLKLAQAIVSVF